MADISEMLLAELVVIVGADAYANPMPKNQCLESIIKLTVSICTQRGVNVSLFIHPDKIQDDFLFSIKHL